ncbi:archaeal heat shock protein Hsp20 [Nitrososphaera sp.]|uniref:archaeal heat shock protein Hsp20 n=1 Tax=Nitrososphaera sp. TaxID=1971748 RepID=UPI002ED77F47
MSSPFDEWFGKRRRSWFPDVDDMMKEMERMMQEAFKNLEQQVPKNLVRERKLEDGSTVREMGPIVYGYSVKIGPDGKPEVRKFGNIDTMPHLLGGGLSVKEEREPLVDVIKGSEDVRVVAEVPGVNKEDLRVSADEGAVTIESATGSPRYYKKINLPDAVDPKTAKSTYKNGILEVSIKLKKKGDGGVSIKIE